MAPTLAEARTMTHAAETAGLLLVVSQNRRFLPGMLALRRAVARLGTRSTSTSEFFIPHRASDYVIGLPEPMLTEMAVHLFDAARAIAGTDAEFVFCDAYRSPWSWFAGNDAVCALFRMAGGIRYSFNAGWSARGHATSWTGSWRVVGELGTVTWDGEHSPVLESDAGPGDADIECAAPSRPFHELTDVLAEFIRALHSGAMPQGESHDNPCAAWRWCRPPWSRPQPDSRRT
jgi:predicted dehydrogenase